MTRPTPGAFVHAAGTRGTYRVCEIKGDTATVFGGDKHRRQWRSFTLDRLRPAKAPDWAKESRQGAGR